MVMDDIPLLTPHAAGMRRVICCHKSVLSGHHPGNSLAAIEECLDAGVPRLEFDLWVLADGSHLLFHDRALEHGSNGSGDVTAQARASLAGLRTVEGAPLAFLDEVVERARGKGTLLQVDLKGFAPLSGAQAEGLARALEPVAGHTIIGSQAHWNVRTLAELGMRVAFDTTLHWHRLERVPGDGLTPSAPGLHGLWDDSPLARVEGIDPQRYVAERVADLAALVPAVEWMVDWRTLFHIEELGVALGLELRRRGIALAAWTLRDEGETATVAKARRLFGLGAETVITDAPLALARYLAVDAG